MKKPKAPPLLDLLIQLERPEKPKAPRRPVSTAKPKGDVPMMMVLIKGGVAVSHTGTTARHIDSDIEYHTRRGCRVIAMKLDEYYASDYYAEAVKKI